MARCSMHIIHPEVVFKSRWPLTHEAQRRERERDERGQL